MLETKIKMPPDSRPITVIDPDDQPMWSSTRTVAPTPSSANIQRPIPNNFRIKGEAKTWLNELNEGTITSSNEMREAFISRYFSPKKFKRLLNDIHTFHQLDHETFVDAWLRILNAEEIFLYKTPNKAFKILEDKVHLKLDFSDDSQNSPKPKTVVSAGGSIINPDQAILMKKFEALATTIDSEFLILRKELKEMRDGHRDNHTSQIYMRDDTSMCDPIEANYMAMQIEANERMKNQVVELERQINQGLRNHQVIIENLERQFERQIQRAKFVPRTTNTKLRHEFVYKPPSIRNENDMVIKDLDLEPKVDAMIRDFLE
ncbi:reverse transcriptase domain-containing protein [Tanacetum coccineum]